MKSTYQLLKTDINVKHAREKAKEWHDSVNQTYGEGLPYWYHTDLVGQIALKYITLIPEAKRVIVLQSSYLHDTIEDCRVNYNELIGIFGKEVAELVFALTNEKGRNRTERANHRYYKGIREVKFASFVKLCDRIANVLHGVMFDGSTLEKYKKELEHFIGELDIVGYEDLVYDLKVLISTGIFNFTPLTEIHEVNE